MPPCSLLIELKSLPAKTCGSYYTLLHRSVLYLVRCPIQSSAATKDSHAIKRLQDQVKKKQKTKTLSNTGTTLDKYPKSKKTTEGVLVESEGLLCIVRVLLHPVQHEAENAKGWEN